jgi:septal ring factor EnvC (AmiA/AmiB activator)
MSRLWLALWAVLSFLAALPLSAQQDTSLIQSRRRLEEIRLQRDSLERAQRNIEGRVSDAGAALNNWERRRDATSQLVNEIERQISGISSQLEQSAAELTLSQDNLAERRAVLERRLSDIYKRGPLYTFQVLLTAESFGDLLTRYKYLYLTSRQDRTLVDDVTHLANTVQQKRNQLLGYRSELDDTRQEREVEMQNYAQLAAEGQSTLAALQRSAVQNKQRLTNMERNEAQITSVIASIEKARPAPGRGARPADAGVTGSLTTADLGKLDWPVDGSILYQFGPQELKTGGVIRHNGIAIAAPTGTPVKAVESGTVESVQRVGTYGLSVMLRHNNGYWSLYMQLQSAAVKQGQVIAKGTVVGTVGGANSEEGQPHLYFEIRGENSIALDPAIWLKRRTDN